jgi:hypothetical protein
MAHQGAGNIAAGRNSWSNSENEGFDQQMLVLLLVTYLCTPHWEAVTSASLAASTSMPG